MGRIKQIQSNDVTGLRMRSSSCVFLLKLGSPVALRYRVAFLAQISEGLWAAHMKKGGDLATATPHFQSSRRDQAALISVFGVALMLICFGLSASGISRFSKTVRMPSTNCASSTFIYSASRNIFEKPRCAIP